MLNARYGDDLRWFIPLGLGIILSNQSKCNLKYFQTADWFNRAGCDNVIELDWWEENCVADKSDGNSIGKLNFFYY